VILGVAAGATTADVAPSGPPLVAALHDPESGRIDARRLSSYLDVPLSALSRAIDARLLRGAPPGEPEGSQPQALWGGGAGPLRATGASL